MRLLLLSLPFPSKYLPLAFLSFPFRVPNPVIIIAIAIYKRGVPKDHLNS